MSHWYEDHPGMTPADWGRLAYEAYAAHTGWKSLVSGADLPWWDALAEPIREAWAVAAQAVRQQALPAALKEVAAARAWNKYPPVDQCGDCRETRARESYCICPPQEGK